jgi:hypothetical protein
MRLAQFIFLKYRIISNTDQTVTVQSSTQGMERHGHNRDVIKVQTAAEHLPNVQEGLCTCDFQSQKGAVSTGVHTINSCVIRVKMAYESTANSFIQYE